MLFERLKKIYFRKWRFEFLKIFSKPIQKNIFFYVYIIMDKSSKEIELIKKIIKRVIRRMKRITSINKDQFGSDFELNELCESEEEFDNINEIENSDDSGNKNYHIPYIP